MHSRATWFPAELTRFFVVAHLVNGSGTFDLRLVVDRLDTDDLVYQLSSVQTFPNRLTEVRVKFEVSQLVVPSAGKYGVTLWVRNEWVAHTDFTVR